MFRWACGMRGQCLSWGVGNDQCKSCSSFYVHIHCVVVSNGGVFDWKSLLWSSGLNAPLVVVQWKGKMHCHSYLLWNIVRPEVINVIRMASIPQPSSPLSSSHDLFPVIDSCTVTSPHPSTEWPWESCAKFLLAWQRVTNWIYLQSKYFSACHLILPSLTVKTECWYYCVRDTHFGLCVFMLLACDTWPDTASLSLSSPKEGKQKKIQVFDPRSGSVTAVSQSSMPSYLYQWWFKNDARVRWCFESDRA